MEMRVATQLVRVNSNMNLLIAIPTYENICSEVFKSVYDLDKCGHRVDFEAVKGYDTATARNNIAAIVLDGKYDYVLMLDSDTLLPKDALQNLLDPQEDIVLGFCPKKNTKNSSSAHISVGDPSNQIRLTNMPSQDRIELLYGGMACAVIKADVFKRVPSPWFKFEWTQEFGHTSEGYYFCVQARKCGYKIWGDARVRCGHLARYFQYE